MTDWNDETKARLAWVAESNQPGDHGAVVRYGDLRVGLARIEELEREVAGYRQDLEEARDSGAKAMIDQMECAVVDGGKFSDERANAFVTAKSVGWVPQESAATARVSELEREVERLKEDRRDHGVTLVALAAAEAKLAEAQAEARIEREQADAAFKQAESEHARAERCLKIAQTVEEETVDEMGERLRVDLADEREAHAALQARCFEGFPSASDGIFDAYREERERVRKLREALSRWLGSTTVACAHYSGAVMPREGLVVETANLLALLDEPAAPGPFWPEDTEAK